MSDSLEKRKLGTVVTQWKLTTSSILTKWWSNTVVRVPMQLSRWQNGVKNTTSWFVKKLIYSSRMLKNEEDRTRVNTNIRCRWLYSVGGHLKSIINRGTPAIPLSLQNKWPSKCTQCAAILHHFALGQCMGHYAEQMCTAPDFVTWSGIHGDVTNSTQKCEYVT